MPDEVLLITKEIAALLYVVPQAGEASASELRGQWRMKGTELGQRIDARPHGGDGGNDGE